jgi:hypothetical protein
VRLDARCHRRRQNLSHGASLEVPGRESRLGKTGAIRYEETEIAIEEQYGAVGKIVRQRSVLLGAALKILELRLNVVNETCHAGKDEKEQKETRKNPDSLKNGDSLGLMNGDRGGSD